LNPKASEGFHRAFPIGFFKSFGAFGNKSITSGHGDLRLFIPSITHPALRTAPALPGNLN
jgi:hypothetical protein